MSTPPAVAVGVVGVGRMGSLHARAYARSPSARLVGVVDLDPARAQAVVAELGGQVFATVGDLAAAAEAVSVAVPTRSHVEVASLLLARGCDVLVEKPLAPDADAARLLVEAAREGKRVLMVGHSERFNPALAPVKALVSNPGFVEVHRLASFSERGTDVDVVLDLMIHDLDLVLHFVRGEVIAVDAVGVPVLSEEVDIASVRLRFDSGTVANLTASRVSLERMRKVRFFERDLYVSIDTAARSAKAFRLVRDDGKPRVVAVDLGAVSDEEPVSAEIEAFLSAVASREEPPVTGASALRVLELADRIRMAMAEKIETVRHGGRG